MVRFLIVLIALFAMTPTAQADDIDTAQADDIDDITIKVDGQTYWALYRFYNTKINEHVYTYGKGEPAEWRKLPHMKNEKILGYVSNKKLPGTKRLYRAVRPDGKHYFYLKAPRGKKNYRIEASQIFVWTKKKEGRIPIHVCYFPDGTDNFFDPSITKVRDFIKGTKVGIGKKRLLKRSIFYIYKKPETESDQKQNEKKDKKLDAEQR